MRWNFRLTSLRKAFKKKSGQVYKELSEWLGIEDLDLDAFDMDDMNFRLKKIPRIYCRRLRKMLYPTERSSKSSQDSMKELAKTSLKQILHSGCKVIPLPQIVLFQRSTSERVSARL